MTKTDTIIGAVIGFLIGIFFFIGLKALQVRIPYSWLILVVAPPLTVFGLFTAAVIGKRILAVWQLAKFVLVGAMNTVLDLAVLNFLMWLSGIYAGAGFAFFKGISFLIAATSSYFWNKHWTFEKRQIVFAGPEYFKFLVIVTIGLLINVTAASLVVNVIGPQFNIPAKMWANAGAFAAVFAAVSWNFLGSKFIVFKK